MMMRSNRPTFTIVPALIAVPAAVAMSLLMKVNVGPASEGDSSRQHHYPNNLRLIDAVCNAMTSRVFPPTVKQQQQKEGQHGLFQSIIDENTHQHGTLSTANGGFRSVLELNIATVSLLREALVTSSQLTTTGNHNDNNNHKQSAEDAMRLQLLEWQYELQKSKKNINHKSVTRGVVCNDHVTTTARQQQQQQPMYGFVVFFHNFSARGGSVHGGGDPTADYYVAGVVEMD